MHFSVIFSVLAFVAASSAASCALGFDDLTYNAAPIGIGCNNGFLDSNVYPSGLACGGLPYGRVLSNKCTCERTVVRPKFVQVVKNVPSVSRVVQNIATPVIEKQLYNTCPGLEAPCGLNGGLLGAEYINGGLGFINNGYIGGPTPCGGLY